MDFEKWCKWYEATNPWVTWNHDSNDEHWQTCMLPIGTCVEEWLKDFSKTWVYQEERDGIRVLFYGRRYTHEWPVQCTTENEAHKFMPIQNHPLRVKGPFCSTEKVYIGSDLVWLVEHLPPWHDDLMNIINAGTPGIWWIQWHYEMYTWARWLGFMNLVQTYSDEKIHYLVRKRFGRYGKLRTRYFVTRKYNSPVQVMCVSNPTLGCTLDALPKTIMILSSQKPCKGPHDDITFLTVDPTTRHLIPATKYTNLR
jgi:hypothetical protein